MAISELQVTYGSALAERQFHRCTDPEGQPVNINKDSKNKVFLWYKSGDGLPIYDISVVHGDDDPSVNFIKLDYDLAKGQSKASFLCIKRCTTESQRAINSMKIVANGNKNGLQGYEQVDLSLSPTAPVYLFYQRQSQEQAEELWC